MHKWKGVNDALVSGHTKRGMSDKQEHDEPVAWIAWMQGGMMKDSRGECGNVSREGLIQELRGSMYSVLETSARRGCTQQAQQQGCQLQLPPHTPMSRDPGVQPDSDIFSGGTFFLVSGRHRLSHGEGTNAVVCGLCGFMWCMVGSQCGGEHAHDYY